MKTNNLNFWLLTILCGIFLLSPTQISAQTCAPPPSGLVAWYPGEGNANDISGNNNNGTLQNGAGFAAGYVGQAFSFDGNDDKVVVPHNSTLDPPSGQVTAEAWVNPSVLNNQGSIINKRTSGNVGYTLEPTAAGTLLWYVVTSGGGFTVTSTNTLPLNTWTHVAGTYDGTALRIYINGQPAGSVNATGSVTATTGNLVIGENNVNTSNWTGLIDEPSVYDRALSQTEIQAIVAADRGGKCKAGSSPMAITITVNTTTDTNDGICNTTHCSLREAINVSNLNAGVKDTVAFNIPGSGPHTITPTTVLPTVTDPVVIDGYTQPGASPNTNQTGAINAVLMIELNGVSAGSNVNGLRITAGNSTVRGLAINRFLQGISLETNGGNLIEGNFIGTNVSGTVALGNVVGGINPSSNNTIGGTTAAARNIISGNSGGILMSGGGNLIQGNLIGTDATGTIALGNSVGVLLASTNNTIGGTTVTARNVISGNRGNGIFLFNNAENNIIQGNFIGTDVSGTVNLGNNERGITIERGDGGAPRGNAIGGVAPGAGNIIAFNGQGGVFISGSSVTGNSVLSNSIFSNTNLGIDLDQNGVTPNDTGDADTGANNLQNYPVLSSAMSGASAATVQGTFNSMPNMPFRLEFFSNPACDPSGFGEGQSFIGTQSVTTDASGNATVNFTSSSALAAGQFITSTATDPNGNTSEFSACRVVLGPTAATVSVGGRITTSSGFGISEARVSITDAKGETRTVLTNQSGYYRFDEAEAGQSYIVSVSRKRYQFMPSTQVVSVNEDLSSVDFTALPLQRMKQW